MPMKRNRQQRRHQIRARSKPPYSEFKRLGCQQQRRSQIRARSKPMKRNRQQRRHQIRARSKPPYSEFKRLGHQQQRRSQIRARSKPMKRNRQQRCRQIRALSKPPYSEFKRLGRQQQRRCQIRAQNELITCKRKGSPCEENDDGDSRAGKTMRSSTLYLYLPEDIWHHIHSLMPMRDAARAACLSRAFLHSWRCHPNLILNKDTIGLNKSACGGNFSHKVDHILRNHTGIGVKKFKLEYFGVLGFDSSRYLESWLQVVKPGIEELTLVLCKTKREYNFPCLLLSNGIQNSIRYLRLDFCALRPTAELGPLRSLTSLRLRFVSITGEELECLLSNSPALEQLCLSNCMDIICLKIPCSLQKLSNLFVCGCCSLKVLENKAPNLSSFFFRGYKVKLSLGETLQMKNLDMARSVHYARSVLPSIMPNLETLVIDSGPEVVNTPVLPTKFLYLKHLIIRLTSASTFSPSYDYFSLVSFLDASPSLETLNLDVRQQSMKHESVFAKSSGLRQIPENRHGSLKTVKIVGFSSAKSLIELTCYILKNVVSLESLTLDTVYGDRKCHLKNLIVCDPVGDGALLEAPRALLAIRTYIENIVPSTVKLTVLEPCKLCHAKGTHRWYAIGMVEAMVGSTLLFF